MSESVQPIEQDVALNAEQTPETTDAANPAPATEEPTEIKTEEEPATEEPKAEEPAAEEPATEEPKAEEPAAEEPAAGEPVAEEPAAEEPVAEEPKAEEPVAEEPAEALVEPVADEEIADEEVADEEPAPTANYEAMDKQQLLEALEQQLERPVETIRHDVDAIKAAFYALRNNELALEREAFVAKGNEEAAFAPLEDEAENKLKDLLNKIKEKRAEHIAAQEAIKVENLQKKRDIIRQIEEISADPDNINRQFQTVQQLQQEFKAVGPVPATDETEIWKQYQAVVERFYDLLKINKELRDYDFKKNLEIKQQLCAEAEALDEETDVIAAFKRLQELHSIWRETGPVAKDLREDLWTRFKNASAVINKKHLAFFEERKAQEKENAEAKTALCEQIEEINTDELKTYAAWDEATKKVIGLQELWRKLGFASRKVNAQLFARFREACDQFFAKKADFFKRAKEEFAANLAKKVALCEKAEELQESTEWRKTTDALVALQKEWKTIGPVAKKHSDAVWKRFIAACDHFFERKKAEFKDVRATEQENLKAKRQVIEELRQAIESDDADAAKDNVRELMIRWNSIGHVPFREKDKLIADYRSTLDAAIEKFDLRGIRATTSRFESVVREGGKKALSERDRLVKAFEQKCAELKTFENNMGFLNARSKSGNSLVQEMERRIERLKEEIAALEQKIKTIDEQPDGDA